MSPRLERNGEILADTLDVSGLHDGLWVDMRGIDPRNKYQQLVLGGEIVGGEQTVYLKANGMGKLRIGQSDDIDVSLHAPVRTWHASELRVWDEETSLRNPEGKHHWVENKGRKLTPNQRARIEMFLEDSALVYSLVQDTWDKLYARLRRDDIRRGIIKPGE